MKKRSKKCYPKNKSKSKFKKFWKSKRAYSTGFAWVFGLVSLFGLGIMYIVFNQVFTAHLVPVIKAQLNSSYANVDNATIAVVNAGIDKYMAYFNVLPFILFFMVVLYMIIAAIRKERESQFQ